MKQVYELLEQLELSEAEATLYITLLEKGPLSVRELALLTKIKRTTTYLYIDALIERELVIKVVRGSRKQVEAIPPEDSLKHLVENNLVKAKSLHEQFPNMLNVLKSSLSQTKNTGEAEIKYYKGKNGVKKIYEEALQAKELRSYFNIELIKEALPDNGALFVEALKNNQTIKIYELFQDTPISKKQLAEFQSANTNHQNYFYKFLPKGVTLSAADTMIYDDTVAIVNVSNQISGIVLKNADYYNNSKELFDLIWKVSPENNF